MIFRVSRYLVRELGREPKPEEIAAKMEWPIDKLRKTLKVAREPISLSMPIGEDEDSHLEDFIEDKGAPESDGVAIADALHDRAEEVLATLTPREEAVLRMRFGMGERERTLKEVGDIFGVTRERIRQIEAKALKKLRHPNRSRMLAEFVDRPDGSGLLAPAREQTSVSHDRLDASGLERTAEDPIDALEFVALDKERYFSMRAIEEVLNIDRATVKNNFFRKRKEVGNILVRGTGERGGLARRFVREADVDSLRPGGVTDSFEDALKGYSLAAVPTRKIISIEEGARPATARHPRDLPERAHTGGQPWIKDEVVAELLRRFQRQDKTIDMDSVVLALKKKNPHITLEWVLARVRSARIWRPESPLIGFADALGISAIKTVMPDAAELAVKIGEFKGDIARAVLWYKINGRVVDAQELYRQIANAEPETPLYPFGRMIKTVPGSGRLMVDRRFSTKSGPVKWASPTHVELQGMVSRLEREQVYIESVEVRKLNARLKAPFPIASDAGKVQGTENVLAVVKVRRRDESRATVGYGEAAAQDLLMADISVAGITGRHLSLGELERLMAEKMKFPAARAAIEMAVLDAISSREQRTLASFINPVAATGELITDITIPMVNAEEAGELAAKYEKEGFYRIKVKVGDGVDAAVARVEAVRGAFKAAGREDVLELLIDANEGYTPELAIELLHRLNEKGLVPVIFEQPVKRGDIAGMRQVRSAANEFGTRVFADESVQTIEDARRVIDADAADGINLKLMKHGGILPALRIAALAKERGLGLMIGGMVETRLGMSAAAHFALAAGDAGTWLDLDTPMLLEEGVLSGGFRYDGPRMIVFKLGGIGVSPVKNRAARSSAPTAPRRHEGPPSDGLMPEPDGENIWGALAGFQGARSLAGRTFGVRGGPEKELRPKTEVRDEIVEIVQREVLNRRSGVSDPRWTGRLAYETEDVIGVEFEDASYFGQKSYAFPKDRVFDDPREAVKRMYEEYHQSNARDEIAVGVITIDGQPKYVVVHGDNIAVLQIGRVLAHTHPRGATVLPSWNDRKEMSIGEHRYIYSADGEGDKRLITYTKLNDENTLLVRVALFEDGQNIEKRCIMITVPTGERSLIPLEEVLSLISRAMYDGTTTAEVKVYGGQTIKLTVKINEDGTIEGIDIQDDKGGTFKIPADSIPYLKPYYVPPAPPPSAPVLFGATGGIVSVPGGGHVTSAPTAPRRHEEPLRDQLLIGPGPDAGGIWGALAGFQGARSLAGRTFGVRGGDVKGGGSAGRVACEPARHRALFRSIREVRLPAFDEQWAKKKNAVMKLFDSDFGGETEELQAAELLSRLLGSPDELKTDEHLNADDIGRALDMAWFYLEEEERDAIVKSAGRAVAKTAGSPDAAGFEALKKLYEIEALVELPSLERAADPRDADITAINLSEALRDRLVLRLRFLREQLPAEILKILANALVRKLLSVELPENGSSSLKAAPDARTLKGATPKLGRASSATTRKGRAVSEDEAVQIRQLVKWLREIRPLMDKFYKLRGNKPRLSKDDINGLISNNKKAFRKTKECIEDYLDAVRRRPSDEQHRMLGKIVNELARPAEAVAGISAAAVFKRPFSAASNGSANVEWNRGELRRAFEGLNLLRQDPRYRYNEYTIKWAEVDGKRYYVVGKKMMGGRPEKAPPPWSLAAPVGPRSEP